MKRIELKASVRLKGNNGSKFITTIITEDDIITLIKKKSLESVDSSYYDIAECNEIDEVKVNY